jgi:hypothetical protein
MTLMDPDKEELDANDLFKAQHQRWLAAGATQSFFSIPEEIEACEEIARLRKMSFSYQARYGFPSDGLAKHHQ